MNNFVELDQESVIEHDAVMDEIYGVFRRLGVETSSSGFFYATLCVWLAVREPERLELVTKWLYPDVARHYATNSKAVITGIRRIIADVWKEHSALLSEWSGGELHAKPTPTQFLEIITAYVRRK